jgi:hypothetical protein
MDYCKFMRERERERPTVEKKEGGQGRDKEEGEAWRVGAAPGSHPRWPRRKQEVASAWPCAGHAGAPCVSTKKTSHFAKSTLALGSFLEKFKTALVLYHLMH